MPPHAWEAIHVKQGNAALAQNRWVSSTGLGTGGDNTKST